MPTFMLCLTGVRDGVESLHVKVMKIERGSAAYKQGVNCNMYLKSLSLFCVRNKTFNEPVIVGASSNRKRTESRDKWECEGDIWRTNVPADDHSVDLDRVLAMVDNILTTAITTNVLVRTELVEYI